MIREAVWMSGHIVKRIFRTALKDWPREARDWRTFWRNYSRYRAAEPRDARRMAFYPCLGEDTSETNMDPIYFYQDAWAFERILRRKPAEHVDVGSHHKFVALLSKIVPLTFIDIRPLSLPMESIRYQQGSILSLPYPDASLSSLSSLCVVEHIGLGRYGDPIDPFGSEKAVAELKRVVKPDGHLYVSLPVDDEARIYFNAHRAMTDEGARGLFRPFRVVDAQYICGRTFSGRRAPGFGVACYELERPA